MIPESNELRFEITTKCNYNCIICPREKLTRKKETMSFKLFKELFDRILSETHQYNTLTFPGMGYTSGQINIGHSYFYSFPALL